MAEWLWRHLESSRRARWLTLAAITVIVVVTLLVDGPDAFKNDRVRVGCEVPPEQRDRIDALACERERDER